MPPLDKPEPDLYEKCRNEEKNTKNEFPRKNCQKNNDPGRPPSKALKNMQTTRKVGDLR